MDITSNDYTEADQALVTHLNDIDVKRWVKDHASPYKELMAYYRCAMMEVETRFKVLNEDLELRGADNPIESIKTRLKSPESVIEKLLRNNYPLTVQSIEDNLFDVAGVRVICSFCSDVYAMADAFLRQAGITLIRKRDYIQEPKASGYRSLNIVVSVPIFLRDQVREMKVEVQLRTLAMDCWASLEHKLRYKKNPDMSGRLDEALTGCADIAAALDRRFEEIRLQADMEGGR